MHPARPVTNRRQFMAGMVGTAAAVTLVGPRQVRGTQAQQTIKLGMIGCGGRGNWIARHFLANGPYVFTCCADYFLRKAEAFGKRFNIPDSRCYDTLSGYKRVLESDVDAVVIESPPCFHPEHAAMAVDAGKHVYVAKPVAVDVPGCLTFADAGRRATAKKLVFLVDFQTRNNPLFREAAKRVLNGDIGRLVAGQAGNHAGGPGDSRLDDANPEVRLDHHQRYLALCGDFIVDQAIHALDMATWFIDADPVSAFGRGGRKVRKGSGDNYDHFVVTYRFPDDVLLDFFGTQVSRDLPGGYEITARVFGSRGYVDTYYNRQVTIRGQIPFAGGMTTNLYTDGAIANIKDFARFIHEGRCDNPTVAPSVRSNLTAILGRLAAYRKTEVTWAQMMREQERLDPKLDGLKR